MRLLCALIKIVTHNEEKTSKISTWNFLKIRAALESYIQLNSS